MAPIFLFVEKMAFDEPFQLLCVKDALQASDVLMNRYNVEYGAEECSTLCYDEWGSASWIPWESQQS